MAHGNVPNLPLTRSNEIETFSVQQMEALYTQASDIINNLDPLALQELMSGTENDVNKLLDVIVDETKDALFGRIRGPVTVNAFDYLQNLTDSFDHELRRKSFNYFVSTVLTDFDMNIHHIEWGNLLQFFPRLCILAARDHSKSFTFSHPYPIWELFRFEKGNLSGGINRRDNFLSQRGMIVTDEQSLAKDFLKLIREEIEENPILRERLFPTKSEGWGKEEITCKNGAEQQNPKNNNHTQHI